MGSGTVFADLGPLHAEKHQLQALLLVQLSSLVAEREVTRTHGAKLAAMKQPACQRSFRNSWPTRMRKSHVNRKRFEGSANSSKRIASRSKTK